MANIVRRNEDGGQSMERKDPYRGMRELMRSWMGWDPFQEIAPLMGRRMAAMGAMGELFEPSFDIRETQDAFVIEADLPGVKPEDVDVTLTGSRMQIQGKREAEEETREGTYYCSERSYGSFMRSFTLPEGIDAEHCSSDFKNGVLKVRIPKRPEAQPKKIQIGAGPKTKA